MQTQILHPLQQLTAQAATIAQTQHMLTICNACRYCEGFCAVFPAMTRRLDFTTQDIHYLANLCHNCGACLHSCQYAPPHEFAVNIPQSLAKVRRDTYQTYAWPAAMGRVYEHNGLVIATVLCVILTMVLALAVWLNGGLLRPGLESNFYAVFPHNTLAIMFGSVFGYALLAIGIGIKQFWGTIKHLTLPKPDLNLHDAIQAAGNIATLKYLDGGHGQGCNESDDRFTHARRRFHHATMYGFLLCFASTCVATAYHYLGNLHAPYAYTSLPVILGTLGGLGLVIGPIGLWVLNHRRHPMHGDPSQKPMDIAFIVLLLWVSVTGLVLLFARETRAMPLLLAIHLGSVMTLFVTLPYSKFVHGFYRGAALLKWAVEKRSPSQLKLGDD